ncbi:MAG: ABC transporter ATP-binding protein, partial [Oscillospiraceae bacterium]|nr:ABC transporter ATP-binding protein [Oscillospiraceae bacterium]
QQAQAQPKAEKKEDKPQKPAPKGNKAQQAARKQLTICERDIGKTEERMAALDADMEAAACDYEKLNELLKEKESVQAELDALYEKWEALSLEAGE